jgi:hypothetical protein
MRIAQLPYWQIPGAWIGCGYRAPQFVKDSVLLDLVRRNKMTIIAACKRFFPDFITVTSFYERVLK